MTNKEIFDFIDRFERSSLHTMKVSCGDFSLELGRNTGELAPVQKVQILKPSAQPEINEDPAIVAPVVGVYYEAPSPDALPFVSVGDTVKQGQTVCLMEAMKMLSEVTAPCDCIITEVLKENGTLAAFGEPLFRYDPC